MGDLFKTLTAGFSRFVLAWLVPSLATLGIFSVYVYPEIHHGAVLEPVFRLASSGRIEAVLVFAFGAVLLSLLFALAALPINRLLEGYTLPKPLRRRFLLRQLRRRKRLEREYRRMPSRLPYRRGLVRERLDLYPRRDSDVLPTRLGNAYKAIETYGSDQYRLDLQTFNYELFSVAPARLLQDVDDARASVDFFVGSAAQLGALSLVSVVVGLAERSGQSIVVSVVTAVLARLAYLTALKNMTDLMYAEQALVNTGRPQLAGSLGYQLPSSLSRERRFWGAWTRSVQDRIILPLTGFDDLRSEPDKVSKDPRDLTST